MSAPAKTQAMQALIEAHAIELKLPTVRRRFKALAEEALREQQTPVAYLAALLEAEMAERSERRERRRLLEARFPVMKRLEDFRFADNPKVSQAAIAALAECSWIDDRESVILIGESELGRTGTNLRRPALQEMLAALPKLKPTYVIFYDLSRVAREEQDSFWLLGEIKRHGAKLESTLERIDDSPTGLLLYTIMTGVNAHRSRMDGEKVKGGLARKHATGGSMGPARIGYLNDYETVEGRRVASISTDPDRVDLVRLAFELAATGAHTITTLTEMLE